MITSLSLEHLQLGGAPNGAVISLDANGGYQKHAEIVLDHSYAFAFNGRLFCLSEDGTTCVVKPGPEFQILATNPLDERCLSSPAIIGDKLLIRTASKLYCLTVKRCKSTARSCAKPQHGSRSSAMNATPASISKSPASNTPTS